MGKKPKGEGSMNEKLRTVIFTVAVTAAFTLMVSGINAALKTRIDNNRLIAEQRVILGLFNLFSSDSHVSDENILALFSDKIEKVSPADPTRHSLFRLKDQSSQINVIPFKGQGFWDNIIGFLAIDADKAIITGLAFTQHGETPGLGGRISEPEFKKRFAGKPYSAVRSDGLRLKLVAEGSATRPDEVDGITGATGTSSAVEKIINNTLNNYLSLNQGGKQ